MIYSHDSLTQITRSSPACLFPYGHSVCGCYRCCCCRPAATAAAVVFSSPGFGTMCAPLRGELMRLEQKFRIKLLSEENVAPDRIGLGSSFEEDGSRESVTLSCVLSE